MKDNKVRKLVLAALMAALVCVATMVIEIPSPANGYVNLGDCFVLLSGWILGPRYGAAAAGIGSMLADIFAGYVYYAPGTLIIKSLMGLLASILYRILHKKAPKAAMLVSGVAAEAVMVAGYFLYAAWFLGYGVAGEAGAAASIPGNLVQGLVALIAGLALMAVLQRTKLRKS